MKRLLFVLICLASTAPVFASELSVLTHRGASGYLPDHSIAARALAYAKGSNYLEQDVVLAKDDVPVVLHDIHLDTLADVVQRFPQRGRADGRYCAM